VATTFSVNLPNRLSLSPDAAYYIGPRARGQFLEGAPVFAVEVRSDGDYGPAAERQMAAKGPRLFRRRHPGSVTYIVQSANFLADDAWIYSS